MAHHDGDNRAVRRRTNTIRREVRTKVDPFEILDSIFLKNYRLSKDLARLLVQQLTPHLNPDDNPLAVPNTIKVLSVLSFYASGSYQAQVGCNWMNCLGRSTVGHFILEVTNALNVSEIQRRWIRFPLSLQEKRELSRRHQEAFKIPGVVGFIDGTEVTITTPSSNVNPQSFWTRKHQYAINCQIICDADLNILNINASHAGASNDSFVYKFSAARRHMREAFNESQAFWLLGDSGYPSEPWLLVPIIDAEEGSADEYYTKCHCKARNCVERCIGVLKARFRCLLRDRALHYRPERAGRIIKACCVLHNMCRKAGIPDDFHIAEGEEEPRPWVPHEYEAELEDSDDEGPLDPALVVREDDHNIRAVGHRVRSRVVDFLDMQRHGIVP